MKKIVLLSLLGLLTITSQSQCTFGSNLKLFSKNLTKTMLFGTGTAVTSAISIGAYITPEAIAHQLEQLRMEAMLSLDLNACSEINKYINMNESFKPVLYGVSAAFGLAALYSLLKTVQSTYKTLTFEE